MEMLIALLVMYMEMYDVTLIWDTPWRIEEDIIVV